MKRALRLLVLVVATGSLGAPAPPPSKDKEDLERLQGEWENVETIVEGRQRQRKK